MWNHDSGPTETIKIGFQKGKIDQRHYYVDPESANAWSALVRAQAYPTYGECKTGLEDLVNSLQWKEALASCQPSAVVMLAGGGAPTKDLVFLQNLLGQSYIRDRVDLYLVDISYYMLTNSRRSIQEHAQRLGFADRVEVEVICDNVLEMTTEGRKLFHQRGKAIFAITGGTIGNFSESMFFRSLGRIGMSGDLLVISADTIGELSPEDEVSLVTKYNSEALHQFLRPVVAAVLNVANAGESIDKAMRRIKVQLLRPGDEGNPSDIPSSYCVIVTLVVEGSPRPTILVTSTRYRPSELEAYAGKFGWEPVSQVPSPLNAHFKQFLFRQN